MNTGPSFCIKRVTLKIMSFIFIVISRFSAVHLKYKGNMFKTSQNPLNTDLEV